MLISKCLKGLLNFFLFAMEQIPSFTWVLVWLHNFWICRYWYYSYCKLHGIVESYKNQKRSSIVTCEWLIVEVREMNEFKYNRTIVSFRWWLLQELLRYGAFIILSGYIFILNLFLLLLLIGIVCIYTIWTLFVSGLKYPEKIVIKENEIVFESFNSKDRYYIDGVQWSGYRNEPRLPA